MWLIVARAPIPDAHVWPGRRLLALADALVWPALLAGVVIAMPTHGGLVALVVVAGCLVAAVGRAWRALAQNHRYRFTTWRWGRWLVWMLVLGYAMKLAIWLTAQP
jgi:hypothetical protein